MYDETTITQLRFTRLNDYLLNLHNDENDTTTMLFPVIPEDLAFIKGSFFFLYAWKETLASKSGRWLIPSKQEQGGIFINGKICSDFNSHTENALLYYRWFKGFSKVLLWFR